MPNVEREPVALFALTQDFVMRIAYVIEACFPLLLRVDCERVGFTSDGVDFATGLANCINNTFCLIAA